jgi:hypothetical protein
MNFKDEWFIRNRLFNANLEAKVKKTPFTISLGIAY